LLRLANGIPALEGMGQYHFSLRNRVEQIDDLGGVELDGDIEAVAFGRRVIRELLHNNPEQYALWTMHITERERTVRSIRLQ
jgi:hypothetical protein